MIELPAEATLPTRSADGPPPGAVIPSHYRWCFGCGVDHETGLHLEVVAGPSLDVRAVFLATDEHQGAPGLAHGGILATAVDEALGALNWLLNVPAVTGKLECEFRRPVPIGTPLIIHAALTGVAGRKVFGVAEGRLGNDDGPVAITGSSVFVQVPLQHFLDHGDAEKVAIAMEERARGAAAWGNSEVNP